MNRPYTMLALAAVLSLALPAVAGAFATVASVVPLDGGCVASPTGPTTQLWDVEPGKTYRITLTGVTECGNGGTDATINVRVNGISQSDPQNADLVAQYGGSPGTYYFDFTLPITANCTLPIFYCTTPGVANSGILARNASNDGFGVHLRASTFGPGCTNPEEIQGDNCNITPTRPSSWGKVKSFYR